MAYLPEAKARPVLAVSFQGGGALGAYQAGVLEGLHESKLEIDIVCGASIGAINSALFLGNPPETRMARLHEFWETVSKPAWLPPVPALLRAAMLTVDVTQRALAEWENGLAALGGLRGFYVPRIPQPSVMGTGDVSLASFYDTSPLRRTIARLCDFERIARGPAHMCVIAANVSTGMPQYFNTAEHGLGVEHIMASGALPPFLPAVRIDDDWYWDGTLVTGAPLRYIYQAALANRRTVLLQVDLWTPAGPLPDNVTDVDMRAKNIQFGSRSHYVTETIDERKHVNALLRHALDSIPEETRRTDPLLVEAARAAAEKHCELIPVNYTQVEGQGHFKDGQFGIEAIRAHWRQGRDALHNALPAIMRSMSSAV
jgi:NTE family protein